MCRGAPFLFKWGYRVPLTAEKKKEIEKHIAANFKRNGNKCASKPTYWNSQPCDFKNYFMEKCGGKKRYP